MNKRKIRWWDVAQKHILYLNYNTNGGVFKELGQTWKLLTFTSCTIPVEVGQTRALQLSSILTWDSTPGICRAAQHLALGYGWGTEGAGYSVPACWEALRIFEWGLCIFCMTNLRPIQSYQFCLYHGCCIHLTWQVYLRWSQRSPLYPDKQLHLPSPVIPLLHTPWTQSQTIGRNGFALLNTDGVQKGNFSGYSQECPSQQLWPNQALTWVPEFIGFTAVKILGSENLQNTQTPSWLVAIELAKFDNMKPKLDIMCNNTELFNNSSAIVCFCFNSASLKNLRKKQVL